jgi:hypothetical protein
VPEERLVLDIVATLLILVQALDADKEKLLTLGFELDTVMEAVLPVKLVTVQLLLVTTPEMVNVVVPVKLRFLVLKYPVPLTKSTIADPFDAAFEPEKV